MAAASAAMAVSAGAVAAPSTRTRASTPASAAAPLAFRRATSGASSIPVRGGGAAQRRSQVRSARRSAAVVASFSADGQDHQDRDGTLRLTPLPTRDRHTAVEAPRRRSPLPEELDAIGLIDGLFLRRCDHCFFLGVRKYALAWRVASRPLRYTNRTAGERATTPRQTSGGGTNAARKRPSPRARPRLQSQPPNVK